MTKRLAVNLVTLLLISFLASEAGGSYFETKDKIILDLDTSVKIYKFSTFKLRIEVEMPD